MNKGLRTLGALFVILPAAMCGSGETSADGLSISGARGSVGGSDGLSFIPVIPVIPVPEIWGWGLVAQEALLRTSTPEARAKPPDSIPPQLRGHPFPLRPCLWRTPMSEGPAVLLLHQPPTTPPPAPD